MRGLFRNVHGRIDVDPDNPADAAEVEATVHAAGIWTGDDARLHGAIRHAADRRESARTVTPSASGFAICRRCDTSCLGVLHALPLQTLSRQFD
ncbi:MAG TPA: hypothetical protein PLE06_11780 [Thiobacillus sp.]|nr:hypothetical protein [Thiobacillus sp.]